MAQNKNQQSNLQTDRPAQKDADNLNADAENAALKDGQTQTKQDDKELPHQEDDMVSFEIIEHEQEPPKKLGLKEAMSTLPENKEPKIDINKTPEPKITTMPKPAPGQKAPAKQEKRISLASYLKKLSEFRVLANTKRQQKMQANLDKIMEYAREKQKVTNNDVERITGVKDAQATRYLEKLVKQNKIVKFGKTSNTFYKPVK